MSFEQAVAASELSSYGEQLQGINSPHAPFDSKGLDESNILIGNPRFSVSLHS